MRRARLADPEPRFPDPPHGASADDGVDHVALGRPAPADPTPRRLLDPVAGHYRRFERAANAFLTAHVYPRVPGLPAIHDRTLRRHLTLAEADIPVRGLPASFDGCRVLLVTDLHAGPFVSPAELTWTLTRLHGTDPDLVLVGGDLVSQRTAEFEVARRALRTLSAPLGVHGVLGNHDLYAARSARRAVEALDGSGVRFLVNASRRLERDGASILLAGIDDWNFGHPDLDAALAGRRPGEPVVLLSHNPDAAFEAARRGVGVVLSGHTHGGQIRVPGWPVLVRMSRYRLDEGRYRAGDAQVVVSRGLGVVGVPFRWGCPPEAAMLTLRPAGSGA
jgi:predicted MPP superfamily phosphohydrolase